MGGFVQGDLIGNLVWDLWNFKNTAKELFDILIKLIIDWCWCLDKCHFVTFTISVLEEKGTSYAKELALRHDSDTVSQDIGFIHIMCGKDNYPIVPVGFQSVPKRASRSNIHASSWFVEHDQLWLATKCDGNRKFSLVTAWQSPDLFLLVFAYTDVFDKFSNFVLFLIRITSFEVIKDV